VPRAAAVTLALLLSLVACDGSDSGASDDGACVEDGRVEFESGLTTVDLMCGKGEAVQGGMAVTVDYVGRLRDGRVFDSTRGREPFRFLVGTGQVIEGWDEGVEGMLEGGVRELRIPPDLAFGPAGSPPLVPPNAPLTYEVELLDVDTGPP
jgi:FKBP-type peptidyl-prolyl cis-trans isomerase